MNSVKAVKTLALGMGALILVGLGLLAYGMYAQSNKGAQTSPEETAAPAASGALGDFGALGLEEPRGAHVAGVHMNGTMLAVIVRGVGPDRVVLVDMARGRRIGTVHLGNVPVEPPVPGN